MIQLSQPTLTEEENREITRVLKTGYLGQGPEVLHFEKELAHFLDVLPQQVACVSSGTAALHLALESLNLEEGQQVLVPTLTFIATFQAITAARLTPVPCDVDVNSGLIDLNDAAQRVTKKTKALLLVNYASQCLDYNLVQSFKEKFNLFVIEDAAHSFGTQTYSKRISPATDLTCYSFDPIKNITCGEGGAIIAKDTQRIHQIRCQRKLGLGEASPFEVELQGWRYHMSDINAAIGRVQLKIFIGSSMQKRRHLYEQFKKSLSEIPEIRTLQVEDHQVLVPHIFVIKVSRQNRDSLIHYLRENQIESRVHYPLNHLVKKYESADRLPQAEELASQMISLPFHLNLSPTEVLKIKTVLQSFFRNISSRPNANTTGDLALN